MLMASLIAVVFSALTPECHRWNCRCSAGWFNHIPARLYTLQSL